MNQNEVEKLTKKESAYEKLPKFLQTTKEKNLGQKCGTCSFFNAEKESCSIVKGFIQAEASCILWSFNNKIDLHWISGIESDEKIYKNKSRMEKHEAGYLCPLPEKLRPDYKKGFRCGTCVYFNQLNKDQPYGSCFPVKGRIHEHACCNWWSQQKNEKHSYASSQQILSKVGKLIDIEDLYC
jgi:hypothetical protein